eukprot:793672-Prymnesium_polylepis.2
MSSQSRITPLTKPRFVFTFVTPSPPATRALISRATRISTRVASGGGPLTALFATRSAIFFTPLSYTDCRTLFFTFFSSTPFSLRLIPLGCAVDVSGAAAAGAVVAGAVAAGVAASAAAGAATGSATTALRGELCCALSRSMSCEYRRLPSSTSRMRSARVGLGLSSCALGATLRFE